MAQDRLQKSVQGIKDPAKRKQAYYRLQREDAEETGNQGQTDKIYKKMGKQSHNVDSSRVDKGVLGAAVLTAGGGPEGLLAKGVKAVGKKLFPKAAASVARAGSQLASRAEGAVQRLGKARPVAKQLAKAAPRAALRSSERQALTGGTPKVKPKVEGAKFGPGGERKGVKLSAKDLEKSGHIKHSPNPKPAPKPFKAPPKKMKK